MNDLFPYPFGFPKKEEMTTPVTHVLMTAKEVAQLAQDGGSLIVSPGTEDPSTNVYKIRCTKCKYLLRLGDAKIVGRQIFCPHVKGR
ncbi:hypothetical protein EU546_05165 [Candidatus Thorarchaeota archaeon]|nr:MAG: hypothetical protein EU546_05165 [Candidatus Thorarchaeota archaeon]